MDVSLTESWKLKQSDFETINVVLMYRALSITKRIKVQFTSH